MANKGKGEKLKKLLQKKVVRIIPICLLLITVGTTFAVVNWISNQITSTTIVTALPIVITGSFASEQIANISTTQTFNYTVSSGTPAGYMFMRFTGPFVSVSDCQVSVKIKHPDYAEFTNGVLVGTPNLTGDSPNANILFIFGLSESLPFSFGTSTGQIAVTTTYNHLGSVSGSLQVSSGY